MKDTHSSNVMKKAAIASAVDIENEIVSPVGKLKAKIDFWRDSGANAFLIDVLSNGYKLPFKTISPSVRLKNNRSTFDNPEIVTCEIEKLVEKGCEQEVDPCLTVVNPLTVAFNKSNKPPLVLDCRHINVHLFQLQSKV